MTDIVERLEGPLSGINRAWVLEAAAEIERLRQTIAYMADHADAPAIIRREANRVLENKL